MNSKIIKRVVILLISIIAVCLTLLAFFYLRGKGKPSYTIPDTLAASETTAILQTETAIPETEYVSPVDFDEIRKTSPDAVAYLEIPGTPVSYPIMYREGNNEFYLNHSENASYSPLGALFIENYNSPDFTDPVSIIYGHNVPNGTYFGSLQKYYTNPEWLESNTEINLYLPDKTLKYSVKAAVPYSSLHILYYYDFSKPEIFTSFISSLDETRSLGSNFVGDLPTGKKPLLILSTCLNGNSNKRYLVVAEQH